MTKKDFLILTIKLFGLHAAVISLFSSLPNNIAFFLSEDTEPYLVLWLIATVCITVGLFWILTFKAHKLVDLLRLSEGFSDERIDLGNIKSEDVLKIGTFVIGGLLFIRSMPNLLSNIFWTFKGEVAGREFNEVDKVALGINALNVLLGYLLFTNYDVVAKRLKRKNEAD